MVHKNLGCLLRIVKIAGSDSTAFKQKLADGTDRRKSVMVVSRYNPSSRRDSFTKIVGFRVRHHNVGSRKGGAFGRPVAIAEIDFVCPSG